MRQLHILHVGIPIGQYINVLVVSSKITLNGYAWVTAQEERLSTSPLLATRHHLPHMVEGTLWNKYRRKAFNCSQKSYFSQLLPAALSEY